MGAKRIEKNKAAFRILLLRTLIIRFNFIRKYHPPIAKCCSSNLCYIYIGAVTDDFVSLLVILLLCSVVFQMTLVATFLWSCWYLL